MSKGILHPDNWFFRVLGKGVDLFLINLLFLLCSLPVLTTGAAAAALYDSAHRCVHGLEDSACRRFLQVFRRELLQSIPVLLLCLPVSVLLVLGYAAMENLLNQSPSDQLLTAMHMAYSILMFLPAGFSCYLFPVLSRFTFTVTGLLSTCFKLTFRHPLTTLILAFTARLTLLLTLRFALPLLFAPVLLTLLWSLFLEPLFSRYAPPSSPSSPSAP